MERKGTPDNNPWSNLMTITKFDRGKCDSISPLIFKSFVKLLFFEVNTFVLIISANELGAIL